MMRHLSSPFVSVRPTADEVRAHRPGDGLVAPADVVMDRAFTLDAPPERVWPWFVQLGKHRGGWYLPWPLERLIPPRRRALRGIDPALQRLRVGDVIPDWGGRHATFTVTQLDAPHTLVHWSRRRQTELSWAIHLDARGDTRTRVHLRLRMAPVKRRRVAAVAGGFVDLLAVAALVAGLRERIRSRARREPHAP